MFKITGIYPIPSKDYTRYEKTEVSIVKHNPYCMINVRVDGDHRDTPEETLIELALERFYQEIYAGKYQNEAIEALQKQQEEMLKALDVILPKLEEGGGASA